MTFSPNLGSEIRFMFCYGPALRPSGESHGWGYLYHKGLIPLMNFEAVTEIVVTHFLPPDQKGEVRSCKKDLHKERKLKCRKNLTRCQARETNYNDGWALKNWGQRPGASISLV